MKERKNRNNFSWILTILFFGILAASLQAAPGDLDSTFGTAGKVRVPIGVFEEGGPEHASASQPDGKIIVVGVIRDFDGTSTISGFGVVRYNTNGSLDSSFGTNGKVLTNVGNGGPTAVTVLSDGKILVAGTSNFNSNQSFALVKYNTNGTLDSSFGINGIITTNTGGGQPNAITVQSDGKIVLAGNTSYFVVVRYNTNGSLDTSFDGDGIANPFPTMFGINLSVGMQGSKIVVGGYSDRIGTLFRLNSNGSVDTTFGNNGLISITSGTGSVIITSLTFAAVYVGEEKIIVTGFSSASAKSAAYITVWSFQQANGAPDTTFGSGGKVITSVKGIGYSIKTQFRFGVANKIVVAGSSGGDFAVLQFMLTGALDTSFDGDGIAITDIYDNSGDAAYSMFIQPADNKIVVTGYSYIASDYDFAVVRYNTNGTLDTTFDADGKRTDNIGRGNTATANSVAIQSDGKIVAAGSSSVARFNPNGTLDTLFDFDGQAKVPISNVAAVAIQTDGKIVVAGKDGNNFAVARLNTNGTLDTSFNVIGRVTTGTGYAKSVKIQTDGRIVVAGYTGNGSTSDFVVVRYNTNGTLDASFSGGKVITSIGANTEDIANSVTIQTNGKIVVAGQSSTGSGVFDFAVVRYNTNGTLDTTFNDDGKLTTDIGGGSDVGTSVVQTNGKILVAGSAFNNGAFALVRYNDNGLRDQTFDGDGIATTATSFGILYSGNALAIQANGKILVAGYKAGSSVNHDFYIIRFNTNGSLDTTYQGGTLAVDFTGGVDDADAMILDSSGRVVVAGAAAGYFGLIRMQGDTAARSVMSDSDTKTGILQSNDNEYQIKSVLKNQMFTAQFGLSTDQPAPADFTGDGKTDIAFWRPVSGEWFVLRSEDNTYYSFRFGASGDIPAPADYDGDGKADAAVFRPSNSTWYISKSSGGMITEQFGASGDVPVPADFDGDGRVDLAFYRAATGEWWINRSTEGLIALQFGASTDKVAPGDYTGDGKADIAVFRPSNGLWYILRSDNLSFYSVSFGAAGDVPAPGDYDGDGKFDFAVFRLSNITWYVNRSSKGALTQILGTTNNAPIQSDFNP